MKRNSTKIEHQELQITKESAVEKAQLKQKGTNDLAALGQGEIIDQY